MTPLIFEPSFDLAKVPGFMLFIPNVCPLDLSADVSRPCSDVELISVSSTTRGFLFASGDDLFSSPGTGEGTLSTPVKDVLVFRICGLSFEGVATTIKPH